MSTTTNITADHAPNWNSPDHHGPVVSVVTWLLIIAVVLAVFARTSTRFTLIKSLKWDDITILIATVLAIGQSIAVSVQAKNGLGSPSKSLSLEQIDRFQKSNYASDLLLVTILGLVKASVCIHIYSLTPVRLQKLASMALGGFCTLWACTSFLVVAFRCKAPRTWELSSLQCINLLSFWTYYGILNILTDLALLALPIPIVVKLQVSTEKKAVILGCYAIRFLAVASAILQLYFLQTKTSKSTDYLYNLWIPTVCMQAVIAFSIISACFPFLKFLIDALETGMVRIETQPAHLINGQQYGSGNGKQYGSSGGEYYKAQGSQFRQQPSHGGGNRHMVRGTGTGTGTPAMRRDGNHVTHSEVLRMNNLNDNGVNKNGLHNVATKASKSDDDVDSQSSQTHIIRKVEWSLTEENTGVGVARGV